MIGFVSTRKDESPQAAPLEREEAEEPLNAAGAHDEAWDYGDFIDLEPDSSE